MSKLFDRIRNIQIPLTQLLQLRAFSMLLVAGLIVLLSLDFLLVRSYQRDQAFRLTLMAQKLQAQISSSINEHIAALLSINVVYQNFVDINRNDFEQYGKSITAHLPGFDRLLFIDPNYHVNQVYPNSPQNRGLFGVTVLPNTPLYQNLKRAKAFRKETSTGLIAFLGERRALLGILPVYRGRNEFLGFAVGQISLDNIWESFQHAESFKDYQIQLVDPDKVPYFEGNNLTSTTSLNDPTHAATVPFYVTGKRWLLILHYNNPFDALFFERLGLWTSGIILLTFMLMLIARNSSHKSALGEVQKKIRDGL